MKHQFLQICIGLADAVLQLETLGNRQAFLKEILMVMESLLGPLLLSIYVNETSMPVKCDLFLYVQYLSLISQSENDKDIGRQLNEDFGNICDWFVDFKLQKQPLKVFY